MRVAPLSLITPIIPPRRPGSARPPERPTSWRTPPRALTSTSCQPPSLPNGLLLFWDGVAAQLVFRPLVPRTVRPRAAISRRLGPLAPSIASTAPRAARSLRRTARPLRVRSVPRRVPLPGRVRHRTHSCIPTPTPPSALGQRPGPHETPSMTVARRWCDVGHPVWGDVARCLDGPKVNDSMSPRWFRTAPLLLSKAQGREGR